MGLFKTPIKWSSSLKRNVLSRKSIDHQSAEVANSSQEADAAPNKSTEQSKRAFSVPYAQPPREDMGTVRARSKSTVAGLDLPAYYEDLREEGEQGMRELDGVVEQTQHEEAADAAPKAPRPYQKPLFSDLSSDYSDDSSTASPAQERLGKLPAEIWCQIANYLDAIDAAALAVASKTLRYRLGASPWNVLNSPDNKKAKIDFLRYLDHDLPNHLLCFLCAIYHARTAPGKEKLQASYITRPIFSCPNVRKLELPHARLTHGRDLPYAFVQLATRAHRFTPAHGIPLTALSRSWKCKESDWSHGTRFHIHENGHLLMRVQSTCHAKPRIQPVEERLMLYSRSDYSPYFSVCAHWSHGNLMRLCKCALSHVPAPAEGAFEQLKRAPKIQLQKMHAHVMPKMCDDCKPLRRCRECPTEYSISLKLVEDRKDPASPFKQAFTLTRWSDLGDGSGLQSPEWAACNGDVESFDSLAAVKEATLCSIFEAAVSRGAPGGQVQWLDAHRGTGDVY